LGGGGIKKATFSLRYVKRKSDITDERKKKKGAQWRGYAGGANDKKSHLERGTVKLTLNQRGQSNVLPGRGKRERGGPRSNNRRNESPGARSSSKKKKKEGEEEKKSRYIQKREKKKGRIFERRGQRGGRPDTETMRGQGHPRGKEGISEKDRYAPSTAQKGKGIKYEKGRTGGENGEVSRLAKKGMAKTVSQWDVEMVSPPSIAAAKKNRDIEPPAKEEGLGGNLWLS